MSICFNEETFILEYASSSTDLCFGHFFGGPGHYDTLPVEGEWVLQSGGVVALSIAWLLCVNLTNRLSNSH